MMGQFARYERYKPSGVEWLGDIPEHWEVNRVKSFALVQRGASPRPISSPRFFDDNGQYAWVRIEDVTKSNKYLLSTKQYLSKLGASYSVKQHDGDLFLSIAGSVGKPIITKIDCCIHDGFVCFKWFSEINKEFLFYIFLSGSPFIGLGKHGTQLNLNTTTIGGIKIPVPSLSEQKRIVEFLDRTTSDIDRAIAQKQRLLELLEEQKTILINQAVTKGLDPNVPMKDSGIDWIGPIPQHWEVKRVGLIGKVGNGSTPNRSNLAYWHNGSIPWLNSSKVNEVYIYSADQFITQKAVRECHLPIVENNDLLIAITGEGKTRGTVAISKIQTTTAFTLIIKHSNST